MRKFVLLDEQLDHQTRHLVPVHDVRTASYQKWNGLKNGVLLKAAEDAGVQVILTNDKNMKHQQNIKGRKIAVVVLSSRDLTLIASHAQKIKEAIDAAQPGEFSFVDIGR